MLLHLSVLFTEIQSELDLKLAKEKLDVEASDEGQTLYNI